jgi:membrane-bound serine protease (ClpP class)
MLALLSVGVRWSAPTTGPATLPTVEPGRSAVIIVLEGEVNDFTKSMLERRLESARNAGATDVILQINTWGGSVVPAIEISQLLKRQDDLRVTAFVEEKAISAGAMIALACEAIYMQPGSMLGDCAPIVPGQQLEKTERAKAEGPILAEFADSAERHGYDPLLVAAMVSVGRVVHYVRAPSGERRFVGAEEYKTLVTDGEWKPVEGLPNPVDDEEGLLTVTADQAMRLGLSRGTMVTAEAMADTVGLQVVGRLEHSVGESVVALLSSTAVRGLATVVLMLSLYAAFQSPGHGMPEALAVAALGVLLGVPLLTGYAGWLEVLLVVVGIGLLAVELFVIPGFGIAGITGIVMILAGLTLSFVPAEPSLPGWLPSLSGTYAALWRGLLVVTVSLACTLVLGAWLNRYLPSVPFFGRLVLNTTVGSEVEGSYATVVDEAAWPEPGATGRALTDLRPGGTAAFADPITQTLRTASVVSDSGFIGANTQVFVHEVHGNRIVVRASETS